MSKKLVHQSKEVMTMAQHPGLKEIQQAAFIDASNRFATLLQQAEDYRSDYIFIRGIVERISNTFDMMEIKRLCDQALKRTIA